MDNKTCGTCQYNLAGQCYRFPPSMVLWPVDNQHPITYMPYVTRPDVHYETPACGEYKLNVEGR